MPKTVTQSKLSAKLGVKLDQAVLAHKDDTTKLGNMGLPDGINNGIARLSSITFGEFKEGVNKGQLYMMAQGVVVAPAVHNGMSLAGRQTKWGPEPICDTPAANTRKSLADHVDYILAFYRTLGVDTKKFTSGADFETYAAHLLQIKPYYNFRTWKGSKQEIENRNGQFYVGKKGPYATADAAKKANPFVGKEPRVNEDWGEVCQYTPETDTTGGMDDSTGTTAPADEPTPDVTTGLDEFSELAEQATNGDSDAEKSLVAKAKLFNISQATCEAADSWEAVAQMIRDASANDTSKAGEGGATIPQDTPGDATDYSALGAAAAEGDEAAQAALNDFGATLTPPLSDNEYESWEAFAAAIAEASPGAGETYAPEKGGVVMFKPPKARKKIQCEITAVFSETVSLKNLVDGKTIYKGIKYDQITPVS